MDIVVIGPPGVGKGTQAFLLEQRTGLLHLATGDLFRQQVRDETDLGREAKSYLDKGELVPDDVVIGMVLDRLGQPDAAGGVIFDGFPRTTGQAVELGRQLDDLGRRVDAVVVFDAPRQVLLKRIVGRQTCVICGRAYNIYYTPSREEGRCDVCGGDLHTRSDDTWETARHRLEVFLAQTRPLVDHYGEQGVVRAVDGVGEVDEVTHRVIEALGLSPDG